MKPTKLLTALISSAILLSISSCKNEVPSQSIVEALNAKESESQDSTRDFGELLTTIEIAVKANEEEKKNFEDGIVPWISIEHPEKDINRLIDAEKLVTEVGEVSLYIDYPLNNPVSFIVKSPQNGFTKKELVLEISKKYHEIYTEEEKTAKTKTVPMDQRKDVINRNETDGIYGLWGHDIQDLDLSSIEVYKTTDGKIALVLGIES